VRAVRLARRGGQPCELAFQQVDLCEVAAAVAIAASLAGSEVESAVRVLIANAASAQVDDRCLTRTRRQWALAGAADAALMHIEMLRGHSFRVVKDHPDRVTATGPQTADAVSKIHAIDAACSLDGTVVDR
jgi:hypothetical protein